MNKLALCRLYSTVIRCSAPGDGLLTWTLLSTQPVTLTIKLSDRLTSSLFTPVLRVCNCLNGGTCQYGSISENHQQGKFQVSFEMLSSNALFPYSALPVIS